MIFLSTPKFSLEKILRFTLKKYPGYQEMLILRALIFFKDAEDEDLQRGIRIFDKNFSWEKAKEKFLMRLENTNSPCLRNKTTSVKRGSTCTNLFTK